MASPTSFWQENTTAAASPILRGAGSPTISPPPSPGKPQLQRIRELQLSLPKDTETWPHQQPVARSRSASIEDRMRASRMRQSRSYGH